MSQPLILEDGRFFDSDPDIRRIADGLYEGVKDLPLVCPHGHVDPGLFSKNEPFPDPTELIVLPDHYIYRMLYSQGITLEALGIPTVDGQRDETDNRKIWQIFGENFHFFAGTPTGVWLNHEFATVFGVEEKLEAETAMRIYDQISETLQSPEFLPRALFERFNIEVLTTTDGVESPLAEHQAIKASGWEGKVIPTFRPDGVTNLSDCNWSQNLRALSELTGRTIDSFENFLQALRERRAFFQQMGAAATDHGVFSPAAHTLAGSEAENIFQRALAGKATQQDAEKFTAHMLMEMAGMSAEDGLVMQIHPGAFRNHHQKLFEKFGPDRGADIPIRTEFTQNLHELLNRYGSHPNFRLIMFTLDESTYARELAPLAGHYPALRLGPPWWFNDSIEGMTRYRQMVTETAGIYNTTGFNDDTRAFPSIPARHDLSRRVDCNFLAGLVARHVIDLSDARIMSQALAYDLVKAAYKLD